MIIIDGKKVSNSVKDKIATKVLKIKNSNGKTPHLAAVLVGENGASMTYVNSKIKSCQRIGFQSSLVKLPEDSSEEAVLNEIEKLNKNPDIDGFIVQLPLPKHIDSNKVLLAVDPKKDVDGFHPVNFGKMALDFDTFIPATPFGILELIKAYNIKTQGKKVVVVGRSHIVGKPISILLGNKSYPGDATVTTIHSHSTNQKTILQNADIIVTALGQPGYLKEEMVKEGVTVIDVGITRVDDPNTEKGYRIVGDVDFENVAPKCNFITPVPGGVGPMTIAMLLQNTLLANMKYANTHLTL